MSEKPILFSGEMVRAILDGRKTQTRRVILGKKSREPIELRIKPEQITPFCPYGRAGDRLWVRETWCYNDMGTDWAKIDYRADDGCKVFGLPAGWKIQGKNTWAWQPSIFMPRWASRIALEVTAVRVERVQDISQADARAEGAMFWYRVGDGKRETPNGVIYSGENAPEEKRDYVAGFKILWDSINAKRGYDWNSDPFVWVVEFERVE